MSSYTKWDRAAYVERAGGEEEAERRRKALMARQSGYQLAEERKRHGLTQAELAQAMASPPDGSPRSSAAKSPPSTRSPATCEHSADASTSSLASATTPSPSPQPKRHDQICCPVPMLSARLSAS